MNKSTYSIITTILFVIALFTFPDSARAQNRWTKLNTPVKTKLNKLWFIDSLKGWVVGDSGIILKTTNGGFSWDFQNSGSTNNILGLFMLNDRLGWALAHDQSQTGFPPPPDKNLNGTIILKTTNGGTYWENETYPDPGKFFFCVYFSDSLNGWMGGAQGVLVGTSDGGVSWFPARIEPPDYPKRTLRVIKFFSHKDGYAVGGDRDLSAVIWKTKNSGENWVVNQIGSEPLYGLHFLDSANVLGVGGDPDFGASVVRTTNAGSNWEYNFIGIFGEGRGISFRTPTEGWVPLGYSGSYMYTQDAGSTWTSFPTPTGSSASDVQFPDERNGFMSGDNGTVLKYTNPYNINVARRWNIVSVPVTTTERLKDSIFATAISDAYEFTGTGYRAVDTLVPGSGYWLKFPSSQEITIYGASRQIDTIAVRTGWNLVGSVSNPVAKATIVSEPANIISSGFFSYKNGYETSDTIRPGSGYWVKVNSNGKLILNGIKM